MKKNLINIFFVLVLVIAVAPLVPAFADTAGPLDHVVMSPTSANISVGGTQQFTAQGQDSNNVTIQGLTYDWYVVAGGGTIDEAGLFKAGNITGTFTNTIQVIAAQEGVTATAYVSVVVTSATPAVKPALPPGWSKGKKNGWEGDTPPGWSQGQKKGWQDNMPPGLAKGKKG